MQLLFWYKYSILNQSFFNKTLKITIIKHNIIQHINKEFTVIKNKDRKLNSTQNARNYTVTKTDLKIGLHIFG